MKLLFWGYLFAFLHFTINGIDLLPNFVGYLFIHMGLNALSAQSPQFARARPWAIGLSVFHLLILAVSLLGTTFQGMLAFVVNLAAIAAALYLAYLTVRGIQELEQATNTSLRSARLLMVWKLNAGLQLVLSLSSPFASTWLGKPLMLLAVAVIVVNIVFVVFLYQTNTLYERRETPPTLSL